MRRLVSAILASLALTLAAPSSAGGRYGPGWHGHWGPGPGWYGPGVHVRYGHGPGLRFLPPPHRWYRPYPRYRGDYAAAGFALGLAAGALSRPVTVVERRVLTRPAPRVYAGSAPSVEIREPALAPPATGYRRARDGTCWLLEAQPDGSTSALPQPPEYCD